MIWLHEGRITSYVCECGSISLEGTPIVLASSLVFGLRIRGHDALRGIIHSRFTHPLRFRAMLHGVQWYFLDTHEIDDINGHDFVFTNELGPGFGESFLML
jgi:hypothetical protein